MVRKKEGKKRKNIRKNSRMLNKIIFIILSVLEKERKQNKDMIYEYVFFLYQTNNLVAYKIWGW